MARILVVDDEPDVADLMQSVLEDAGHAVETVYGGRAALSRLAETAFDLVVCDLQMPDVDGIAVYHAVQERALPRPAVLFITGYLERHFPQAALAPVLSKPIGIEELRARVQDVLDHR